MSAAENKAMVKAIYDGAAVGDARAPFLAAVAEDVVWVVTGEYSWSRSYVGRQAVVNDLQGHFRSRIAGAPKTIAFRFIAEDEFVVVEARGDNVTVDGQRYDQQYCMVYRFEDGKVKEIREYADSALVERSLGPFPA